MCVKAHTLTIRYFPLNINLFLLKGESFMADLKTSLRELSVATTIGLLSHGVNFKLEDILRQDFFWYHVKSLVREFPFPIFEYASDDSFNSELQKIINNGYNLGKAIFNNSHFHIRPEDPIAWLGYDTQKEDPIDISVGRYGFSLKEESFILENMGLYKLINCFTGSTYKKRHIFKDYAPNEYENWFNVTWGLITKYLKKNNFWLYTDNVKQKKAEIVIQNKCVFMRYYTDNQLIDQSCLMMDSKLATFEKNTSSKTREEVFSRFINLILNNDTEYIQAKKTCAEVASKNLAKELRDNLNYSAGLPRFLRIHEKEYYYAKTTSTGVEIYHVPSLTNFQKEIVIDSIESSVPATQANILTTIRNISTDAKLVLRNECRFSHGQFNGTPEAKMYYVQGSSLDTIYERIC
jgi:hypothetical protein